MNIVGQEVLDEAEIERYLANLVSELLPNEYLGLRLLGKDKLTGLYDNWKNAAKDVKSHSGEYQIYASLNSVKKVPGMSINSLSKGSSFKDKDISKIRHLLIDIDPVRAPNTSATNEEVSKAFGLACKIAEFLVSRSISYKAFFSGNGFYLLLKVPYYQANRSSEVKLFLDFLDKKFSNNEVHVDTTVFNAARIFRVAGTLNIKGPNSLERPHRIARQHTPGFYAFNEHDILEIFKVEILNVEHGEQISSPMPVHTVADKGNYKKFAGDVGTLDIVSLFKDNNLYVRSIGSKKHIVLCPNRNAHSDNSDNTTSTVVFEADFGKWPGFNCQHNHCQHLKLDFILNTYFTVEQVNKFCHGGFNKIEAIKIFPEKIDDFVLTKASDLLREPNEEIEYIVDKLLIKSGFSLLISKPKVGKTTLLRSLAVQVSRGEEWLGFKTKKCLVVYLGLEEHRLLMKKEFEKLGVKESDENLLIHAAPAPSDAVSKLKILLETIKPSLLIIDTMHKLVRFEDGNDYSQVNLALEPLSTLARQHNCHILCTHHLSKADRDQQDTILGSTAISGAFDTLIYLTKAKDERVISATQRYGESLDTQIVKLDPFTRHPYLMSMADNRKISISEIILKTLKESPSGLDDEAIVKIVGKRKEDVKKAIKELFEEKKIIRMGAGIKGNRYIYSLPAHCIPPLEGDSGGYNISNSIPISDYQEGE